MIRVSETLKLILKLFLENENKNNRLYGWEIITTFGLSPGTVYPILNRLEEHHWVESYWDHEYYKTNPRRYYELTPQGHAEAMWITNPRTTTPRINFTKD